MSQLLITQVVPGVAKVTPTDPFSSFEIYRIDRDSWQETPQQAGIYFLYGFIAGGPAVYVGMSTTTCAAASERITWHRRRLVWSSLRDPDRHDNPDPGAGGRNPPCRGSSLCRHRDEPSAGGGRVERPPKLARIYKGSAAKTLPREKTIRPRQRTATPGRRCARGESSRGRNPISASAFLSGAAGVPRLSIALVEAGVFDEGTHTHT